MDTPNPFLEIARQGRNEWWRYVTGMGVIFICWTGGQVAFTLPLLFSGTDATHADLLLLTALLLSFAPALVAVAVVVRLLHGRPFLSLVTPYKQVRWGRVAAGWGAWLALAAVAAVIEAILYPGRYRPTSEPLSVLPFLLVAALLIPVQAGTEELVYRGYLLQGMGLLFRQPLLLATLNGALFALPHAANPETSVSLLKALSLYFLAGFFWALVTLRSGTLELAWGAHTANNFFTVVVANYQTTALPSHSFFVVQEIDVNYQLLTILIGMGLFYLLLARPARHETDPEVHPRRNR
jgi:membrane protease YdiL (CAAX protease family)